MVETGIQYSREQSGKRVPQTGRTRTGFCDQESYRITGQASLYACSVMSRQHGTNGLDFLVKYPLDIEIMDIFQIDFQVRVITFRPVMDRQLPESLGAECRGDLV